MNSQYFKIDPELREDPMNVFFYNLEYDLKF